MPGTNYSLHTCKPTGIFPTDFPIGQYGYGGTAVIRHVAGSQRHRRIVCSFAGGVPRSLLLFLCQQVAPQQMSTQGKLREFVARTPLREMLGLYCAVLLRRVKRSANPRVEPTPRSTITIEGSLRHTLPWSWSSKEGAGEKGERCVRTVSRLLVLSFGTGSRCDLVCPLSRHFMRRTCAPSCFLQRIVVPLQLGVVVRGSPNFAYLSRITHLSQDSTTAILVRRL